MRNRWEWSLYLGIFFLSSSIFLYQIALMRFFSIKEWYHSAFMVVSLALLGFGSSGSFLFAFQKTLGRVSPSSASFLSSVSMPLVFILTNHLPFDPYLIGVEWVQILYLGVQYLLLSIPFFFGGLVVALCIHRLPQKAGVVYFFSLAGSGFGCILLFFLPLKYGIPSLILEGAIIGAMSSFVFLPKALSFCLIILLFLFFLKTPPIFSIKLSPYKDLPLLLRYPSTKILRTEWDPALRVDLVSSKYIKYAPGLSLCFTEPLPPQKGLLIDGGDLTGVIEVKEGVFSFVKWLPQMGLYEIAPSPSSVLILGVGGGHELVGAIIGKARKIKVVEGNPLLVRIFLEEFKDIVSKYKVEVVRKGIRGYANRTKERYRAVILPLTGGFKGISPGSFSLREEYLFTVEGMKDWLSLLRKDGVLCITRWLQTPPTELLKITSAIILALGEMGVKKPEDHLMIIRSIQTSTFFVKPTPFTHQEITALWRFVKRMRFDLVWFPGIKEEDVNRYNILSEPVYYLSIRSLLREGINSFKDYPYEVFPSRDEKPFFFHFFKASQLPLVLRGLGKEWRPYGGSGYLMILILLGISVFLSFFLIVGPLIYKRRGLAVPKIPLFGYFSAIGFGFMFVELSLMGRLILLFERPVYSFSVLLTCLLIFSGLGSLLSQLLMKRKVVICGLTGVLCLLILIYTAFIPYLLKVGIGETFLKRVFLVSIFLFPLGVLMGFPFPTGVRIVGLISKGFIPWVFGINGCASVVGSILSMIVAVEYGYDALLVGASICYGVAFFILIRLLLQAGRTSPLQGSLP